MCVWKCMFVMCCRSVVQCIYVFYIFLFLFSLMAFFLNSLLFLNFCFVSLVGLAYVEGFCRWYLCWPVVTDFVP